MKKKTLLKLIAFSMLVSVLFIGCEKDSPVKPADDAKAITGTPLVNVVNPMTPEEFDLAFAEAEEKCFRGKFPRRRNFSTKVAYAQFPIEDGGYVFTPRRNPEGYPVLSVYPRRWGWAGNLAEGVYIVPIWANAWGNDTENAIFAGRLKVEVYPPEIYVKYLMVDDNLIKAINVYLSDEQPIWNFPWNYGYTETFDPMIPIIKNIFDFEDVNGDGKIWLIAHAIVDIP